MENKYEDMERIECLKSMGHILVNVHDLVNEISNNNGQNGVTRKDAEPSK